LDERATIHARDATGDYRIDRFRAGEDVLHAIEATELGDISGKRVLHLQCHIGLDTLFWHGAARQSPAGFSSAALTLHAVCPRDRPESGLAEGTVEQAPELTPGPVDLVYTTWGTICGLPYVKQWAKVIASVAGAGRGALLRGRSSGGSAC